MRRWLRPLWMLLALILLIEAWLWDHLTPAVRWLVDALPWRALKERLAQWLAQLSPYPTLLVFAVPVAIYLGLEALALWPLAQGRWFTALVVLAVAKISGAALTAFVFDLTRDKLLQLNWFRAGYGIVLGWRDTAHALADPYMRDLRGWFRPASGRGGLRLLRMARWLRRRIQAAR
jgi:hypothetical protein